MLNKSIKSQQQEAINKIHKYFEEKLGTEKNHKTINKTLKKKKKDELTIEGLGLNFPNPASSPCEDVKTKTK